MLVNMIDRSMRVQRLATEYIPGWVSLDVILGSTICRLKYLFVSGHDFVHVSGTTAFSFHNIHIKCNNLWKLLSDELK